MITLEKTFFFKNNKISSHLFYAHYQIPTKKGSKVTGISIKWRSYRLTLHFTYNSYLEIKNWNKKFK